MAGRARDCCRCCLERERWAMLTRLREAKPCGVLSDYVHFVKLCFTRVMTIAARRVCNGRLFRETTGHAARPERRVLVQVLALRHRARRGRTHFELRQATRALAARE